MEIKNALLFVIDNNNVDKIMETNNPINDYGNIFHFIIGFINNGLEDITKEQFYNNENKKEYSDKHETYRNDICCKKSI